MREVTAKSVKLNRDLDGMLEQALERDLLVRIGWGKQGDEKPKKGEIGVITHLPPKSRVLLLGDLGECAGAMNEGGTFTLQGGCASMLGAFQTSGRITVERDAGDRVGHRMSGGEIIVQGSAAEEAGAGMRGGVIIVRGHVGKMAGAAMEDGVLIILGSAGTEPGLGMLGGRVIVAGSCPPPGEGAAMRSITEDELEELSEHLDPLGLQLDPDALVLVPTEAGPPIGGRPEYSVAEGFDGIGLVPSSRDRLPEHSALDTLSLILPAGLEEHGLLCPLPWIVECERMTAATGRYGTVQPGLVRTEPRYNDLILIDESNLLQAANVIQNCAGMVLDLNGLPAINDAEVEALLVSLYSRMRDDSLVFLKDSVARVDHLFRLVVDLDLDGAVVDAALPGGGRAASALPRIGLAAQAMNLVTQGRNLLIELDEAPAAEDLLIAIGAGCVAVVAPPADDDIEAVLGWLDGNLRGWMRELGVADLAQINRSNLRALDHDTAAISGLRLIGYERPLPMWLGN